MSTAYDEVAYPTTAFGQTHPDRLATHAALMGLPFAPPGACRVLDIGGGDGMNIIGMALTHPGSQFVGVDLSGSAIERGQQVVEALGLANVRLFQADVADFDPGSEPFDYAIAHGLYSWVPQEAREATMALIGRSLAPNGVAFVSYNAYPGAYIRQIIRDLMLLETRGLDDPQQRLAVARRKLAEVVDDYPEQTVFQQAVKARTRNVLEIPDPVLLHDDLGGISQPFYLHQVLEHAARHGLSFLTEADPSRLAEGLEQQPSSDRPPRDVEAFAQELDFRYMHGFRQTLLVRADAPVDRRRDATRIDPLFAACGARRLEANRFEYGQETFEITDPELAGAVERLGQAWPGALPVRELVPAGERRAALLNMYGADLLWLHTEPSPFSLAVSDRPVASPLARLQIARGETRLITLRHTVADVTDAPGRAFIACLDGSRTHGEIAAHMAQVTGAPLEAVAAQLSERLSQLARMPLLAA